VALVFSAGIVPVRKNENGTEYLLLRSYGYWDFPKGRLESGENHLEAALRETDEESGLSDFNFKWGRVFHETVPYKTKIQGKNARKVSRYYISEAQSGDPIIRENPETGQKEHDEFRWVSFEESKYMPLHPRIKKILTWAREVMEEN
jgi:bis(5'-nucleosidyl)-tetraphosphatase